ncbi:unnamed protein product [Closterium sp. NIES-65]|nr:unnamed protein product [Closterium sp. NIES-65]
MGRPTRMHAQAGVYGQRDERVRGWRIGRMRTRGRVGRRVRMHARGRAGGERLLEIWTDANTVGGSGAWLLSARLQPRAATGDTHHPIPFPCRFLKSEARWVWVAVPYARLHSVASAHLHGCMSWHLVCCNTAGCRGDWWVAAGAGRTRTGCGGRAGGSALGGRMATGGMVASGADVVDMWRLFYSHNGTGAGGCTVGCGGRVFGGRVCVRACGGLGRECTSGGECVLQLHASAETDKGVEGATLAVGMGGWAQARMGARRRWAHGAGGRTARLGARRGWAHGAVGRTLDGRTLDGRTLDGRTLDGRTLDGRTLDGRTLDGRTLDGRTLDGRTLDGRTLDGRTLDGRTLDGHTSDGRTLDGRTLDGRMADGPMADGPMADGPMADGHSADVRKRG